MLIEPDRFDALRRQSVAEILAAIGDCPDITLVHGPGNRGDELICEGTRSLLRDRRFRDIAVEDLARGNGRTVLLVGSGAFSRAYHEWMPRALTLAEARFERVIVLPSSFDVTVDEVRETLQRTRAVIFAREVTSYDAIRPLCDARLALDGAFYYDYEPHRHDGAGALNTFRTDREAPPGWTPPADNVDISASAASLEAWLEAIASHAVVRTNRAHVMIAAALLGKQVELGPCSTNKVDAIADYALTDFPVRRLPDPDPGGPITHGRVGAGGPRRPNPRVTPVVLSGDDRGHPWEHVDTELAMLLGSDAEAAPEATARLVAELDAHPQALAVTPRVVLPSGVQHCGGELREWDGLVEFRCSGAQDSDSPRACEWVPHTAVMVRTAALIEHRIDPRLDDYAFREWSYRVGRTRPDAFRACPAATVVRHRAPDRNLPHPPTEADFRAKCMAIPPLSAIAHFYASHGLVLADLFLILPTLADPDGTFNLSAARTVLTLLDAIGGDRFLELWAGGELEQLLDNQAAALVDQVAALGATVNGMRSQLDDARSEVERVSARLSSVESTRAWRLARTYYRARERLHEIVRRA